jgi:hypothetical protein
MTSYGYENKVEGKVWCTSLKNLDYKESQNTFLANGENIDFDNFFRRNSSEKKTFVISDTKTPQVKLKSPQLSSRENDTYRFVNCFIDEFVIENWNFDSLIFENTTIEELRISLLNKSFKLDILNCVNIKTIVIKDCSHLEQLIVNNSLIDKFWFFTKMSG